MSKQTIRSGYKRNRLMRRAAKRESVPLNLVSMIDVFTTLVFFLLLTSTNAATVRTPHSLQLPQSLTHEPPHDVPVLTITETDIELQGTPVMTVADAEKTQGNILAPLKTQLEAVPLAPAEGTEVKGDTRGELNIMADKELPYSLVKKLMATAGDSRFAQISLSVDHRAGTLGSGTP